jgi:hypothetical protein
MIARGKHASLGILDVQHVHTNDAFQPPVARLYVPGVPCLYTKGLRADAPEVVILRRQEALRYEESRTQPGLPQQ